MFPLRRAAQRFLAIKPAPFAIHSRTITSFTSPLRIQKHTPVLLAQRRWASHETKPAAGDVPVSELQPTPQEEVENSIHEDNAAPIVEGSAEGVADDGPSGLRSSGARDMVGDTEAKPQVYVGNLFFDVTEDDINKEFSRFGNIERVKIIRDPRGLSKGFGYVSFETVESATSAIEALNAQLFEGRRLTVQYAATVAPSSFRNTSNRSFREETPKNPPSTTLFIGNMSWDMTDRDLNNLFRGIKNIIDVRVAIDRRTGQPRGFAHADFVDVKSAMEAMKELSTKETYGRKLKLDYSYASGGAPRTQAKDQGDL